mmetsp:Transcript_27476/g.63057  ORF Transcript_27476/g.63057 Transcript_27476/m.63057 type:complete len:100 (-) Transcript_27476:152-451(-)
MIRKTVPLLLAAAKKRTTVRDPRRHKAAIAAIRNQAQKHGKENQLVAQELERQDMLSTENQQQQNPLPIQPSVGSTLGQYVLLGGGVAIGATLVRMVIG